jgi:hypothetical protein
MKKILLVSVGALRCGVHDYGIRIHNILSKSKKYNYVAVDIITPYDLAKEIQVHKPDAIIYNYYHSTMPWLQQDLVNVIRLPQIIIYHESVVNFNPDGVLSVDCTFEDEPENNIFGLPRPLLKNLKLEKTISSDLPIIGSFGFGFENKNFPYLAKLVREQFDKAILRYSIAFAEFGDSQGQSALHQCKIIEEILKGSNIQLEISHDYLNAEEMVNFLHTNDLNVFCYDVMPGRSISSCTDYALSAKKPIALSKSNMFDHFKKWNLPIYFDETPLSDIMKMGFESFEPMYNEFSDDKILEKFDLCVSSSFDFYNARKLA